MFSCLSAHAFNVCLRSETNSYKRNIPYGQLITQTPKRSQFEWLGGKADEYTLELYQEDVRLTYKLYNAIDRPFILIERVAALRDEKGGYEEIESLLLVSDSYRSISLPKRLRSNNFLPISNMIIYGKEGDFASYKYITNNGC